MATTQSYQESWKAYQDAVQELYAAPTAGAAERSGGQIYAQQLDERGATLTTRSAELRETLTTSLTSEALAERELAALKLLAAAAYDMSLAVDLIELEEIGPTDEPERSARSAILAADELRNVLDAPLEGGVSGLLEVERSVLPNEPEAARAILSEAVADFITYIPEDAADLSQTAVGGVANLGLGPMEGALSLASQEILARLPEGAGLIATRAAQLVTEAIRKLRAAIGEELEEQAREEVTGWLDDIQEERDTVTSLLDKLYETERIEEEVTAMLSQANLNGVTQYNQAIRTLEGLMKGHAKSKNVLNWVMRILAFVKTPLLTAPPWGPLALYASYLGILTYAIYSGGDYLDWYRTGNYAWLDRVSGLRTTVRQALAE